MNKKIDSLQTIRALAFLGIFASHADITIFSAHGAWGVSVFILLSGFLMYYSYYDDDRIREHGFWYSVRFGLNKIKRLYPLHIAMFLTALPLFVLSGGFHKGKTLLNPIAKIAANLLLLQTWVPDRNFYFSFNGVSWYLSLSLFLYAMFPFILSRMRRYRGTRDAALVLAGTALLQFVLDYASSAAQAGFVSIPNFVRWFTYIFPVSRLWEFIIGCNLGYLFVHGKRDREISKTQATILEALVGAALLGEWVIYVRHVMYIHELNCWWVHAVLFTLTNGALIYLFARNRGIISRVLTNRLTLFLAGISASAFMIHQMVFRYLKNVEIRLLGGYNNWVDLFLCLAITIVCSLIWDYLFRRVKCLRGV